ncbi:hypothetical protein EV360DRAFT_96836 [Lentinula raphanica]|nr:hypothetical protein EV360DRAFT_96836 [Lentinula raphanica]
MCINSCHAFTGPWEDLEYCDRVPRLRFSTILLGPQLAASRRSVEGSESRTYRSRKLADINRIDVVYDDIWCGEDIRELVDNITMTEDDIAISASIDGAQLYQNKKSDCWIGIWIQQDYAPEIRYKKKKVLPNVIIPGLNKPKHTSSFLFPGLHHLSALQKENDGSRAPDYSTIRRKHFEAPHFEGHD